MSTKTYQGNTKHLSLLITVKGEVKRITLLGGRENGTYTTKDHSEQKAIENTDRFKMGEIKIISETGEAKEPAKTKPSTEVQTPIAEPKEVNVKGKEGANTNLSDLNPTFPVLNKDYPEAKRVQDAQRILVKEYGAKAKEVAVKKDILEFAKKINVTFSSLQ